MKLENLLKEEGVSSLSELRKKQQG
jgi:hypothetical protein